MQVSVSCDDFKKMVSSLTLFSANNDIIEAYSQIVFEAKDGKLRGRSTNSIMGGDIAIPATIKSDGVVAVKAQKLDAWAKLVNAENISLTLKDDNKLVVKAARSQITLPIYVLTELPSERELPKDDWFIVDAELLQAAIKRTIYAVSDDFAGRPVLASLHIDTNSGKLVFAGMTGVVLAICELKNVNVLDTKDVLVSKDGCSNFAKILADHKGEEVTARIASGAIYLICGDNRYFVLGTEGKAINHDMVLESIEIKSSFNVDIGDIKNALRLASAPTDVISTWIKEGDDKKSIIISSRKVVSEDTESMTSIDAEISEDFSDILINTALLLGMINNGIAGLPNPVFHTIGSASGGNLSGIFVSFDDDAMKYSSMLAGMVITDEETNVATE